MYSIKVCQTLTKLPELYRRFTTLENFGTINKVDDLNYKPSSTDGFEHGYPPQVLILWTHISGVRLVFRSLWMTLTIRLLIPFSVCKNNNLNRKWMFSNMTMWYISHLFKCYSNISTLIIWFKFNFLIEISEDGVNSFIQFNRWRFLTS